MAALLPPACVADDVSRALAEDIGDGDLTVSLIKPDTSLSTRVITREAAVLSGRPWFQEVFAQLPGQVSIKWHRDDGDLMEPEQTVCDLHGDAAAMLTGERTALNFIQTLSGTATITRTCVQQLKGTKTRLLDTRKTLPGLRQAQKYAVRCGGGYNHRMGLYDAILIKENHIAACGSVGAAVAMARNLHPDTLVEVEVESLEQLEQACEAGAQRALLDNFDRDTLRKAVERFGEAAELEASGDITLKTLRPVALTGVDYISTGAITKHVQAIDFSMRFI